MPFVEIIQIDHPRSSLCARGPGMAGHPGNINSPDRIWRGAQLRGKVEWKSAEAAAAGLPSRPLIAIGQLNYICTTN